VTAAKAIVHEVEVANPLKVPYRTGSYLIYDEGGTDHFRSANGLTEHPYRASGSHQLDFDEFVRVLGQGVVGPDKPSTLYLVDLREETHGFFDGIAVSWYADNDFANVGQPKDWITAEEKARLGALAGRMTQVFTIEDDRRDNREQQRVMPASYRDIVVGAAYDEAEIAKMLTAKFKPATVAYVRIPVTDHCAPSDAALDELRTVANKVTPNDWVHFHCHGGDGRTTTFLAMYDMWCWKKANYPGYLSLEGFACRQYKLAPHYCLNPFGCNCVPPPPPPSQPIAGWKRPLALERWQKLQQFHDDPLGQFREKGRITS
jgi:hypothetical protein